jgi:streptomycin 6-kinase
MPASTTSSTTLQGLRHLSARDLAALRTARGRAWVGGLHELVQDIADAWHLGVEGSEVHHGYHAVVVPVDDGGRPAALKLVWPARRAPAEARALAAWRGRGMVGLLRSDARRGALLLERLDASRFLSRLSLEEGGRTAGALIRTLAVEAPGRFASTGDEARDIGASLVRRQRALGDPVPRGWLESARQLASALSRPSSTVLVHADLHWENILASRRRGEPWVAIDPKTRVGDPERSVAELLWTRKDAPLADLTTNTLLDHLVDAGRLDRERAVAWSVVRSVDYWLWGLENGLTEDPRRCRHIVRALTGPR